MADRAQFLAHIRSQLHECNATHGCDSPWATQSGPVDAPGPGPTDLADQFLTRLRSLGGHGDRLSDLEGARAYILDLARQRSARSLIRWHGDVLDALDVDRDLQDAGVSVRATTAGLPLQGDAECREFASQADIGLSTAEYAVAETGSVVLASSSGYARSVTALPPSYVVVVPLDRLVARLDDVIRIYAERGELPSSLCFHTGPSRSGDIEQSLAIGVHGPGDVHVLLIG